MRYHDLTEALDTRQLHAEALAAMQAILGPASRYDLLFNYRERIVEPVRAALGEIAARHQDARHPVTVLVDFQKSARHLGKFLPDGEAAFIMIELANILHLDREAFEDFEVVVDIQPEIALLAKVFAHEFMHYRQHCRAWGKVTGTRSARIRRAGAADAYLSLANEVQAWAADAARDLISALGSPTAALEMLRGRQGIADASVHSLALRHYLEVRNLPAGAATYRDFLTHLVRLLRG